MIPRAKLIPGVKIRVVKEQRGSFGNSAFFWPGGFWASQAQWVLKRGEMFEVLESPKTTKNVSLVRVRRVDTTVEGDIRYGEIHFHCDIVEDPRPPGRSLWDRLDDESV